MKQRETPPASPVMEEVVEEVNEDELELITNEDVEVLDSYVVEEMDENGDEEMSEEEEIIEAMEREDAFIIFDKHSGNFFNFQIKSDILNSFLT